MELDSLKDLWKELGNEEVSPENEEQLMSMLHKRSRSPIAKMKRNLLWEVVTVIVLYVVTILYYIIAWQGQYWEVALLLFIVGLFFIFYYYRKNKLLQQMQCVDCEVKSNLQQQLTILEKYVNFYFVTSTLLTPIVYFLAGMIVFFKSGEGSFLPRNRGLGPATDALPTTNIMQLPDHRYIITFIVIGIAVTICVYFLNRWYVNKLYGQHIQKLKELLQQMEEIDS